MVNEAAFDRIEAPAVGLLTGGVGGGAADRFRGAIGAVGAEAEQGEVGGGGAMAVGYADDGSLAAIAGAAAGGEGEGDGQAWG